MTRICSGVLEVAKHGQVVGYVRVSSVEQNLDRQLAAIGEVDKLFQDKQSGKDRTRLGLASLIGYVRQGDVVKVASMDRLARSLIDLQQIVDDLVAKGAQVKFVKEHQTYGGGEADSMSRLMLQVLGAFAEFERNLIRERQAEGIRLAKAAGRYKGRARKLTAEQLRQAQAKIDEGIPKARIARDLGVGRSTLYRALEPSLAAHKTDASMSRNRVAEGVRDAAGDR